MHWNRLIQINRTIITGVEEYCDEYNIDLKDDMEELLLTKEKHSRGNK